MTGVFLQVRLDSTRLPNKALLELGGRTVVEHAMLSLKRIPVTVHAVLTDRASVALLEPRAVKCGFQVFVGPRENVLERFVFAARYFGLDELVRATGDNPLVSWELARQALAEFRNHRADYFGYDGPPLGTGVEVLRVSALERAVRETQSDYDREHVAPYIYRHPGLFTSVRIPAPLGYRLPQARVTLDTASDYAQLCAIYDHIYDGAPIPVLRLVRLLREGWSVTRQPERNLDDYSAGA